MPTYTVEVKKPEDGPALVSFHQGLTAGSQGVKSDAIELACYQKGTGKKRKRVVVGKAEGVTYRGADFGDDSMKLNACDYAIGVVDDATGTLSVTPVEHIYVMQPEINARSTAASSSSLYSGSEAQSHFQRKQSLAEAFGSRKKQNAIRAAQSNIISVENIAGATSVENVMAEATGAAASSATSSSSSSAAAGEQSAASAMIDAGAAALEANRKMLLPPYVMSAATCDEIYPMDSLIPPHIASELENYYKNTMLEEAKTRSLNIDTLTTWTELLTAEGVLTGMTTEILSANSHTLSSKRGRKNILPKLMFLSMLQAFYALVAANRDRTASKEDVVKRIGSREGMDNKAIMAHISDNFSAYRRVKGQPGFSATKSHLDKLLLRILIVALSINNFGVDLTILAGDLKLTTTIIGNLAKEAGCKITKSSMTGHVIAELTAPLVFPAQRVGGAGKKR